MRLKTQRLSKLRELNESDNRVFDLNLTDNLSNHALIIRVAVDQFCSSPNVISAPFFSGGFPIMWNIAIRKSSVTPSKLHKNMISHSIFLS